jgi:hypothetical protein
MADAHEGFRKRIDIVFGRWASQIEALLWEARPKLVEGTDTARLARFVIATLEGAILVSRVQRDPAALEGIATDLKRFIAIHVRDGGRGGGGGSGGRDGREPTTAAATAAVTAGGGGGGAE